MKITVSWLKDHLETNHSAEQIAEKLTALGHEVDNITNPADLLKPFTIAEILSAEKHPNADKLKVCMVNTGDKDPIQIVCGAPNARAGIKVVFAKPGTYIPAKDFMIKAAKIRDVESFGMLCSESELDLGDNHDGIIELPKDAPIGKSFVEYKQLDDPVIEISLTPNRADCFGIRGLAIDLAAAGCGTLKPLNVPNIHGSGPCPISVKRDFTAETQSACPHFRGRLIKGVKNGPSPIWLQNRMKAVGLKSISALVDITNYLTYDLCRPLHVFDANKIKDQAITVRLAKSDETMEALDEETYTLKNDMTVIADDEKILSIGGIMGSLESGSYEGTTDVFVECAYFDSERTAKTGRALNIISDARTRFERGIDPNGTESGLEIATQMIIDLCGGTPTNIVESGAAPYNLTDIHFKLDKTEKLTGVKIPANRSIEILKNLGFHVKKLSDKEIEVTNPSWRYDIAHAEDLVEEIVRIEGYDKITAMPVPKPNEPVAPLSLIQQRVSKIRRLLTERNLMETITWSMVNKKLATAFGGGQEALQISNPITVDLEYMRPSILPNLLTGIKNNVKRGLRPVNLYEVGPTYQGTAPEDQEIVASGVRFGLVTDNHWSGETRSYDVFDVKNDCIDILNAAGIPENAIQVKTDQIPEWMHPYRSGVIFQGPKKVLGYFGEIHPLILKLFGIKQSVLAFELFISRLAPPKKEKSNRGILKLSSIQPVEKDLAFIVDEHIPAQPILDAVSKADKNLITRIHIFDAYIGTNVDDGKKSIGVRFRIESHDKTLTDADIATLFDKIVKNVHETTGGVLRDGKA
jgi:phenylalanyl-tRNA synthetase beta chain